MPELENIDFLRTQPSEAYKYSMKVVAALLCAPSLFKWGEHEGDLNFDPDPHFGPYLNWLLKGRTVGPRASIFGTNVSWIKDWCILHTFQSVNPPHGQWPAPMGSWRVPVFPPIQIVQAHYGRTKDQSLSLLLSPTFDQKRCQNNTPRGIIWLSVIWCP